MLKRENDKRKTDFEFKIIYNQGKEITKKLTLTMLNNMSLHCALTRKKSIAKKLNNKFAAWKHGFHWPNLSQKRQEEKSNKQDFIG